MACNTLGAQQAAINSVWKSILPIAGNKADSSCLSRNKKKFIYASMKVEFSIKYAQHPLNAKRVQSSGFIAKKFMDKVNCFVEKSKK